MIKLILVFALALAGGNCQRVYSGGANERIDPFNGCYAEPDGTKTDMKDEADFINHRGRYLPITNDARKDIAARCWAGEAICIHVPSVCYANGEIVYRGPVKHWRPITKIKRK